MQSEIPNLIKQMEDINDLRKIFDLKYMQKTGK